MRTILATNRTASQPILLLLSHNPKSGIKTITISTRTFPLVKLNTHTLIHPKRPHSSRLTPYQYQTLPSHYRTSHTNTMTSLVDSAKKSAAFKAVAEHLLPSYTWIGIGSGSTVVFVVDAIAAMPREITEKMTFIPTGDQSKLLIIKAGLRLGSLDQRPVGEDGLIKAIDVTFDGADEVDEELNLIKGGGACLWQEKFVAASANKFVCVADYRKISPRLCTKWAAIPIEVHPMAARDVLRELVDLGSIDPKIRQGGSAKAGPVVTDNGMWLIDAPFTPLMLKGDITAQKTGEGAAGVWEIERLASRIKGLLGVVEIGIFYGMNGEAASAARLHRMGQKPMAAYFGMEDGTVSVQTS